MFTVYDSKVEAFLPPFFMASRGAALRSFGDTCNDKNHHFNKHPEDYTLFLIGTFDDSNSEIKPLDTPHSLGLAQEFISGDLI